LRKPTTTTEECVSIKNPPRFTDLAPKIPLKFARPDKTIAGDITNDRSPQPTASVTSARKTKQEKANRKEKNSIAQS
jgi:hypothetical protein